MTPQEKELLTRFLDLLAGAQAGQKDAEAEALIKEACARQPDAAYLLVQRTLQLEHLLQASQSEVEKLKAERSGSGAAASNSFIGDAHAWGRPAAAPAQQTSVSGRPLGPAAPAPGMAAAAAPAAGRSWNSGLFGNLAMTAAGVVAGSFLYQGIQGLMNRGDQDPANASTDPSSHVAQAPDEPELLNSYDTPSGAAETYAADDMDTDFG